MPAKKRAQRAADRLLRMGSEHFEVFFENAPIMMGVVDREGRIVGVNRRWREVLGYRADEVIGKSAEAVLTQAEAEKFLEQDLPEFHRLGRAEGRRIDAIAKDGEVISLSYDVATMVDAEGNRFALAICKPSVEAKRERNADMLAVVEQLDAIAVSLRIIGRAEEERTEISAEQIEELVVSARGIARNVSELIDAVVSSFDRLTPPAAGG